MARNEVVGWLNADDLYLPGALGRVGKALAERPDALWATGPCLIIDADGREIRHFVTRLQELPAAPLQLPHAPGAELRPGALHVHPQGGVRPHRRVRRAVQVLDGLRPLAAARPHRLAAGARPAAGRVPHGGGLAEHDAGSSASSPSTPRTRASTATATASRSRPTPSRAARSWRRTGACGASGAPDEAPALGGRHRRPQVPADRRWSGGPRSDRACGRGAVARRPPARGHQQRSDQRRRGRDRSRRRPVPGRGPGAGRLGRGACLRGPALRRRRPMSRLRAELRVGATPVRSGVGSRVRPRVLAGRSLRRRCRAPAPRPVCFTNVGDRLDRRLRRHRRATAAPPTRRCRSKASASPRMCRSTWSSRRSRCSARSTGPRTARPSGRRRGWATGRCTSCARVDRPDRRSAVALTLRRRERRREVWAIAAIAAGRRDRMGSRSCRPGRRPTRSSTSTTCSISPRRETCPGPPRRTTALAVLEGAPVRDGAVLHELRPPQLAGEAALGGLGLRSLGRPPEANGSVVVRRRRHLDRLALPASLLRPRGGRLQGLRGRHDLRPAVRRPPARGAARSADRAVRLALRARAVRAAGPPAEHGRAQRGAAAAVPVHQRDQRTTTAS